MADETPGEKQVSAGDPGIEDIRSSWQKLDESASPPKNLMDWQMRQRELKEQERQKKTASAQALHGYRGDLKESDTKLAALREEDRKGKLNAEQLLHQYRAPVDPNQKSSDAPKSTTGPADAVASVAGASATIEKGNVAAIAESFNTKPDEAAPVMEDPISMGKKSVPSSSGDPTGVMSDAGAEIGPNESVAQGPASVPSQPEKELDSSGVLVKEPETQVASAQPSNDDWVTVSAPNDNAVRSANPNEGATYNMQQHSTAANGRVDIEFSFGLLSSTTDTEPSVTKYMKAVEEIVKNTLALHAGQISYNPSYPPFVTNIEKDESFLPEAGKSNVVRYLVHGAVPVFVSYGSDFQAARAPIRGALKAAVNDGSFLNKALQLEKQGIAAA